MDKDPAVFLEGSSRTMYYKNPYEVPGVHDFTPAPFEDANMVSSLLANGRHAPAIDLDVTHHLVPSTTVGHAHLFIDVPMPWWKYRLLLWAMKIGGVISPTFYRMAVRRRQTLVRKPGIKKGQLAEVDRVIDRSDRSSTTYWADS